MHARRPSPPRGRSRSRNGSWARLVGHGLGGLSVVSAAPYKAGRARCNRRRPSAGGDVPELPEVETVRRGLEPVLAGPGHRARRGPPARPALAVPAAAGRAADRARGSTALRRRSKYLLADLDRGETLIVHLGMSGRMLVSGAQVGRVPPRASGAGEARPRRARPRGRRAGHLQRRPPLRGDGPLADRRARARTGCSRGSGPSRSATASTPAISAARLAGRGDAGQGGAARPARGGGPRQHLRLRGAVAGADSRRSGSRATSTAGEAEALVAAVRAVLDGRASRPAARRCATTARPTASSATSSIPSPSTAARASPAGALRRRRSRGSCRRAGRASTARPARADPVHPVEA